MKMSATKDGALVLQLDSPFGRSGNQSRMTVLVIGSALAISTANVNYFANNEIKDGKNALSYEYDL
jgi:hypothetical protein